MQVNIRTCGSLASRLTRADTSLRMKLSRRDCLMALALAPAACVKIDRSKKRRLSIAAGLTGGVYYVYGGGIAKVVSETLPDVEMTAEATSGSVDNLKFVGNGRADVGFTMADTLDEAVRGQGAFQGDRPVKLLALAALIDNFTHVACFEGAGLRVLPDLKGKVISVGA